MKTGYKLSRTQFEALLNLYQQINMIEPVTPSQKLLHAIQLQVALKLRKLDVEYKPKYKLQLTAAEEIAFMIYWGSFNLDPTSFIGNIVQNIINNIHPKYV